MLKVGIVGGTGYTGAELLRILAGHPDAEVTMITSRAEAGVRLDAMFPSLRGHCDLAFTEPDVDALATCDVVFFATPHNVAMKMVPTLLAKGTRVIDLSADFRIKDVKVWEHWYNEKHACPELLEQAVYGLPETNTEQIKGAQLIACPGCYPTSVELGFLPLLENKLVDPRRLIANSASGVSGAGRQGKIPNLFAEASDSFKAYGVNGHRHLPEIEQQLTLMAGEPVNLTFVPHLLPIIRGIHSTLYADLLDPAVSIDEVQFIFEQRYANAPFVDVLPLGTFPETRTVKGTNTARISLSRPQGRDTIVVMVVEDNLVKGASGQAIQAMNIAFGLEETAGLNLISLLP
jgi:N-acetyl-gamma-glutamyl-phosphate reductase